MAEAGKNVGLTRKQYRILILYGFLAGGIFGEVDVIEQLELTLASLGEAKGGLIDRMFKQSQNRIAMDLRAAPDIPDKRKLVITDVSVDEPDQAGRRAPGLLGRWADA